MWVLLVRALGGHRGLGGATQWAVKPWGVTLLCGHREGQILRWASVSL